MSIDVKVVDDAGNVVHDGMNWHRNAFGLGQWVFDNTQVDIDAALQEAAADKDCLPDAVKAVREARTRILQLGTTFFNFPRQWAWHRCTIDSLIKAGMPFMKAPANPRRVLVTTEDYFRWARPRETRLVPTTGSAKQYYLNWIDGLLDLLKVARCPGHFLHYSS